MELRRVYQNERFAPELRPHQDELVRRMRSLIDEQHERIATLGAADVHRRMIYEMEVERVTYTLRAYLRLRLKKISKLALYLAKDAAAQLCLSETEKQFGENYATLYQEHIDRQLWGAADTTRLPESLKHIMQANQLTCAPELDSHVFCKAVVDCAPFTLYGTTEVVNLHRGEIALLPYAPLRKLLASGEVVLA